MRGATGGGEERVRMGERGKGEGELNKSEMIIIRGQLSLEIIFN